MFLLDMFEVLEVIVFIQIIVQHRHDMRDLRRFEEVWLLIQRVETTDISTRTGRARDGQSQGRETDEQTIGKRRTGCLHEARDRASPWLRQGEIKRWTRVSGGYHDEMGYVWKEDNSSNSDGCGCDREHFTAWREVRSHRLFDLGPAVTLLLHDTR